MYLGTQYYQVFMNLKVGNSYCVIQIRILFILNIAQLEKKRTIEKLCYLFFLARETMKLLQYVGFDLGGELRDLCWVCSKTVCMQGVLNR